MLSDEKGGSKVAVLLYLMVAILVIYVLIKVIPPYMDYYSMDDEVTQELNMSQINSDDVITGDLYAKAQEIGLPINKDDIVLTRQGGKAAIEISWVMEVDFGYGIKRDFAFNISSGKKKDEE